ncbi:aromatic-ring-hydroxylating dioxygenase subunit beta [Actinomadura macra]|uniref:aromatic-ring-hydroxylating dioxygenase subunit beta n=1 Tax=Actinomadura macra TaxID=46164 RepID=UPI000AD5154A|nr:aromatic-ring-hydroxylating dioxygenase subunit beta [Actinomadura macra]
MTADTTTGDAVTGDAVTGDTVATGTGRRCARPAVRPDHTAMLDELYAAYAETVDERQWERWPDLFTEECAYTVQSLENAERGLPLAYMLDDCRGRLLDRVKFVTEVWAGTIEPYRTRHLIQRTRTEAVGDDAYRVRANVVVTYTEADGPPAILTSGHYDDHVRLTETGPLFADKRVYLDGTPTRYLVYPL